MTDPSEDQLDRAAAAALALAAERPWADVTLRDIAHKAQAPLAELYVHAPGKTQVVDWLSRRFNLAALKAGEAAGRTPTTGCSTRRCAGSRRWSRTGRR